MGNSCGWHVDWHDNRQISKVCKKQVNWNTILIKSVAGQTTQSTQKYVLKTVLGHNTVSLQPVEYSVKSYGERTEVAAELSIPWLFLSNHGNDWSDHTQHFSAVTQPQNKPLVCTRWSTWIWYKKYVINNNLLWVIRVIYIYVKPILVLWLSLESGHSFKNGHR